MEQDAANDPASRNSFATFAYAYGIRRTFLRSFERTISQAKYVRSIRLCLTAYGECFLCLSAYFCALNFAFRTHNTYNNVHLQWGGYVVG